MPPSAATQSTLTTLAPDAPPPAYLRQPTIAGDTIVFVADDDLWRVSIAAGDLPLTAVRLTAGLSEPATPMLSPDGRWLAYAGRDEQHSEVWVMSAAGGPARRLTWLGSDLAVRGWTAEGRIVFATNHGQPFFRHWHAWTVGLDGGAPERIPLGAADHIAYGGRAAGGAIAIGRNTGDPARWKRYRGGRAGALWVAPEAGSRFVRLTGLKGNVSCPMWIGERLFFIGDGEGIGNLYSCRGDGSDLRQHSEHRDFYARHAASDGRRIVYQHAADLWVFDATAPDARPRRLDIAVPSARTQAARRFVPAADHLQGMQLHPQGHSLTAEVRGQTYSMALWEGAVMRHGEAAARQRFPQWLAGSDGQGQPRAAGKAGEKAESRTLVAVTDASGEERVVVFEPGAAARELPLDIGRATAMLASPTERRIAITNHRNQLLLVDVDAATVRTLDSSVHGRIEDPAWSPCGGWIAYAYPTSARHVAIKLIEVSGEGRSLLASPGQFRDWSPSFDPAGKYLYFLSLRTYDPVYDSVQFELSFPRAARPYLVALQAGGRPPFDPEPRSPKAAAEARGGDGDHGKAGASSKDASDAGKDRPLPPIEADGLARRIAAFPVAEGRFGHLAGVADGKVVWTQLPLPGAHGRGGHKDSPGQLEVFDFATGTAQTLFDEADDFSVTADGTTLLVRHDKKLYALDPTQPPSEDAADGETASRETGLIDLGRIRIAVDPPREWAQMLREVWRLQRDHFWTEDMSGVDWPAVLARYEPLLAKVATRGELSDLIWELQGELGTSHAYEMGGDHRKPPAVALGHLAAELRAPREGEQGWAIASIVQGDAWDATADSPLNAIGVEAKPGERIVAIGGQPVEASTPPQSMLVHQSGAKALLTLASADGKARRDVIVTLLGDEQPARYRQWVEANRAHVHEASGGKLGYLHVPDMMSAGFAEFHRYFGTECDRDGLIVDLRFNRGGHVSQLLLEKVARKRIAWNSMRWGEPEPYPNDAAAGPVVALTNEHAGSDGDIFSHNFKLMGIGPLIGKRTWGGVIGIWPRHRLIDGSETTQPEYSYWFKDVGWSVENYGTDPTIEVDNAPEDDVFNAPGRDVQLRRAIDEGLAAIEKFGVARPAFGPRPRLG